MSGKVFFDTNVVLYAIGQDEVRTPKAEALLALGGVVSVQVLNELASVARRKLQMTWTEVSDAMAALKTLCPSPLPLTVATHDTALQLAARLGYHIYDALIVASALEANCTILYSEDLRSGQAVDGRLIIENPFATGGRRP